MYYLCLTKQTKKNVIMEYDENGYAVREDGMVETIIGGVPVVLEYDPYDNN